MLCDPIPASPTDLRIGARETINFENEFNGTIDEIRVYNRTLTPGQIGQLFVEGRDNLTTSKIVKEETIEGENWTWEVTGNDAELDSLVDVMGSNHRHPAA